MQDNPTHNEHELLHRIADDDQQAFAALFYSHHQALGSYLFKLTGSKDISEEITQEAFIKAWQHRATLREINSFRSWLFTVSRNRAFNAMRDQARQLLRHNEWTKTQQQLADPALEPGASDLTEAIAKAVEQLPPQQKRAYLLSREQGMTHAQVAASMQLSQETVKRHISMALQSIKQYLVTIYPELTLFVFAFPVLPSHFC